MVLNCKYVLTLSAARTLVWRCEVCGESVPVSERNPDTPPQRNCPGVEEAPPRAFCVFDDEKRGGYFVCLHCGGALTEKRDKYCAAPGANVWIDCKYATPAPTCSRACKRKCANPESPLPVAVRRHCQFFCNLYEPRKGAPE